MTADKPRRIGRYEIEVTVSESGLGAVYRAIDLPTGRPIALKVLAAGKVADRIVVGRFLREATAMRELKHPGIVPVLEIERWQDTYYIAMPWVIGVDLLAYVREHGAMPLPLILDIARQLVDALRHAHGCQVIHRDVKPANIVLTADQRAILVDFGYAKRLDQPIDELTRTGSAMGTPHYISPEQVVDAKRVDHRSDIYSLAATLYHLLVGEPPFVGNGIGVVLQRMMTEPVLAPKARRPDTPEALSQLLLQMLSREPNDRPASMAEVQRRLDALVVTPSSAS
jgi:serine/threonine-protein kinase